MRKIYFMGIVGIVIIFAAIAVGVLFMRGQKQPSALKPPERTGQDVPARQAETPPSTEAPRVIVPTSPVVGYDTDGDSLEDMREISLGTDWKNTDTDGDGLSDGAEVRLGKDPKVKDFSLGSDTDGDGLTDDDERTLGSNHQSADSDADGIDDAAEFDGGTLSPDSDNDGLNDVEEQRFGTNPRNPDTDGDGFKDGAEVQAGYNPKGRGKL